jgi:hypothetical protein
MMGPILLKQHITSPASLPLELENEERVFLVEKLMKTLLNTNKLKIMKLSSEFLLYNFDLHFVLSCLYKYDFLF